MARDGVTCLNFIFKTPPGLCFPSDLSFWTKKNADDTWWLCEAPVHEYNRNSSNMNEDRSEYFRMHCSRLQRKRLEINEGSIYAEHKESSFIAQITWILLCSWDDAQGGTYFWNLGPPSIISDLETLEFKCVDLSYFFFPVVRAGCARTRGLWYSFISQDWTPPRGLDHERLHQRAPGHKV